MLKKVNEQEQLFNYYYNLMSIEYREEILGYENLQMPNTVCSIKVIFKNGEWIRLYQKSTGEVEWY